jgi:hypothetical protein
LASNGRVKGSFMSAMLTYFLACIRGSFMSVMLT